MRFAVITMVLGTLGAVAAADHASAGVFRRASERRKAELRNELSADLSAKIDRDVAALDERLQGSTTAHVRVEAEKLQSLFQTNSQQLAAQVQTESRKLNQLVQQEMTLLRRQSADQIVAEAKQLRLQNDQQIQILRTAAEKQIATQVAALSQESEKQLQAALAKLNQQLAGETKQIIANHEAKLKLATDELQRALQLSLQTEMAKDPDQVSMRSATHAARLRTEMLEQARTEIKSLAQSLTPAPAPTPIKPAPIKEQATIPAPVKPVEDDSPEQDGE